MGNKVKDVGFPTSKKMYSRAINSLVGGVNSPVRAFKSVGGNPIFIAKAQGQYIYDVDGNRYLDFVGSYGPAILGHTHPQVVEAISKSLQDGFCYGASSEKEIILAELIKEAFPFLDIIRFVNSGTEAAMSAIRLARGFTKKNKLIKMAGAYHGHTDALLAEAGSGLATYGLPGSAGVTDSVVRDTIIIPHNDKDALEEAFRIHGDDIAAVLCEAVCGNMGVVLPDDDYLTFMREISYKYESLIIFDEVMSGFRENFGGVQNKYLIEPDITILGKIIGGGMPVGAYGGKKEVMSMVAPLGPVYQAGTLSGNPIAMTGGITTLNILKENINGNYPKYNDITSNLAKSLLDIADKKGWNMQVNHYGTMITPFFTSQKVTDYTSAKLCDTEKFNRFFWHLIHNGIFIAPSQFEAWFMNWVMTESDIEYFLEVVEAFEG